jgi:hypothetical protein
VDGKALSYAAQSETLVHHGFGRKGWVKKIGVKEKTGEGVK